MTKLTLTNYPQDTTTVLDNEFIDKYMAQANGEYVKVYLLILRHMHRQTGLLSVAEMADFLECTEKDVHRALKYWKKQGLIDYDDMTAKKSETVEINYEDRVTAAEEEDATVKESVESADLKNCEEPEIVESVEKNNSHEERENTSASLRSALFVAEQYLQKTLSAREIDTIAYFVETLKMSDDLIDYLIDSCVESGHKSMRYIEKVALSWHEQGIRTAKQAKIGSAIYNKNCYSVLNAYGIKNRAPVATEIEYIRKWTQDYAFSLDLILEACSRTMQTIHKASFEYTDSILKNWFNKKVRSLKDVEVLDSDYMKSKSQQLKEQKEKSQTVKKPVKTKFNNFDEREYNMSDLERRLVQQ